MTDFKTKKVMIVFKFFEIDACYEDSNSKSEPWWQAGLIFLQIHAQCRNHDVGKEVYFE